MNNIETLEELLRRCTTRELDTATAVYAELQRFIEELTQTSDNEA